jgi:hypothetical protein
VHEQAQAMGQCITRPLLQDTGHVAADACRRAGQLARIDADVKDVSHVALSARARIARLLVFVLPSAPN